MRLTGLPNVARYPEAEVSRDAGTVTVRFGGLGPEQTMAVPLGYVVGDGEAVELRLMARLQEMGYEVRRARN